MLCYLLIHIYLTSQGLAMDVSTFVVDTMYANALDHIFKQ